MFSLITWVQPVIDKFSKYVICAYILTIITTVGTYSIVHSALDWVFNRILWIKKKILGKSFIQGTWLGSFYDGVDKYYTVEKFEQTYEDVALSGMAFNKEGVVYAKWTSTAIIINAEKGYISYHYECMVMDKNMTQQGIGEFTFDRKSVNRPPFGLIGFSSDLIDGKRTVNKEKKETDELLEFENAFKIALAKM